MEGLLSLAQGFPRRELEAGEVLLVEGGPAHELYVLLEGSLRIEKGDVAIAIVAEPGACVGEMSLLLASHRPPTSSSRNLRRWPSSKAHTRCSRARAA